MSIREPLQRVALGGPFRRPGLGILLGQGAGDLVLIDLGHMPHHVQHRPSWAGRDVSGELAAGDRGQPVPI